MSSWPNNKATRQQYASAIVKQKGTLTPPGHGNARYQFKDDAEIHIHYFLDYSYEDVKGFQYPGLHIAFEDISDSPRPWIRVYYTLACGTTVVTIIPKTPSGNYFDQSKMLCVTTMNGALGYILDIGCWQPCGINFFEFHEKEGTVRGFHLAKNPGEKE